MNPNAAIQDAFTDRQIALGRYSNGTRDKVLALLRRVEADTINKIANTTTRQRTTQLEAFLKEIREIYVENYKGVSDTINDDLSDLAKAEAAFSVAVTDRAMQAARVNASIQRPTDAQIIAAVKARPFAKGGLLGDWLSGLEAGASARVRDAIRIGFIEGESIDAMVKRLRGTRAAAYKDGIFETSRRGAEALVRTAVNHTAQAARTEMFKDNPDIVEGEMYVALLDSRVTPICRSLDGNIYPVGKGPRPPQHIGCRSYTTVVLKGFPPPPRTSYAGWFSKQSASKQDDILGKTKGRLYREGKLELGAFVDRNGRAYTIDELRAVEPEAFRAFEQ